MTPTRFPARLAPAVLMACVYALAPTADARDLEDVMVEAGAQVGLSTGLDENFLGFDFTRLGDVGAAQFEQLNEVASNIANDRVVPVSSSVSGFTFEYNPDLDVYERSTSTFGPLFTERAQTIGDGRFLMGFSASHLEFDEFEGDELSQLRSSSLEPNLKFVSSEPLSNGFATDAFRNVDIEWDIDLRETIAAFQFTYGLTDRLDIGVVVPLLDIDLEARARPVDRTTGAQLPTCAGRADLVPCQVNPGATSKVSDDYTGVGDVIVRSKWHFYRGGMMDAAAVINATIPTGSPDNLTGLHTMTFRPGLVVSRDVATDSGGISFHGFLGYDIRPDDSEREEVEWGAGVALQPLRRASISVDILGSHSSHNTDFGENRLDASIGTKLMVWNELLADFNVILPLNDDGLRSDAIFTVQFEYTFGD